jgi:long-subunit acyl-CoA synthetase (AMP-forming)
MQKRTLFRLLRETVQAHTDSTFMTERHAAGWVGASFREIAEEARRVAGFLLGAGLQRGDQVTLLAEGRNSWAAAAFGIFFEKLYGEEEDPLNAANRAVLRALLDHAVP